MLKLNWHRRSKKVTTVARVVKVRIIAVIQRRRMLAKISRGSITQVLHRNRFGRKVNLVIKVFRGFLRQVMFQLLALKATVLATVSGSRTLWAKILRRSITQIFYRHRLGNKVKTMMKSFARLVRQVAVMLQIVSVATKRTKTWAKTSQRSSALHWKPHPVNQRLGHDKGQHPLKNKQVLSAVYPLLAALPRKTKVLQTTPRARWHHQM
mmetsp:Transcript_72434/g.141952  ORF Transcript_72434/g.141952 Transcript_72434/m.141952 type:complete len:209 (-) Transcript_72434:437-1063(-)